MASRFVVPVLLLALLAPAVLQGSTPVFSGVVESAPARPLPGARVELLPILSNFELNQRRLAGREVEPVATTRTGADGRFRLPAPGPGLWRLRLSASGFVPVTYSPLAASGELELPGVVLVAAERSAIEMRRESGAAVPGTWIQATTSATAPAKPLDKIAATHGWRVATRRGTTGDDGRLAVTRGAGEWLDLVFAAPWSDQLFEVREVEGLRYFLEPSVPARHPIEVTDADGVPQAGVLVCLGQIARPVGSTGADGRFVLAGDFASPVQLLLLAADGRTRSVLFEAPSDGTFDAPARFALPPTATVAGRVVDASRQTPVAGALVWSSHDPGRFVLSDEHGAWSLPAPADGRFWVQAGADGFLPRAVDAEPNGPPLDVPLEPATSVTGQVVDPAGRPLDGVRLEAVVSESPPYPRAFRLDRVPCRAASDADGRFALPDLWPPATYRVTASRPGWVTETVTLDAVSALRGKAAYSVAPRTLKVVLQPRRAAFGLVLDADGRPLAGVEVRVSPAAAPRRRGAARHRPATSLEEVAADPFRALSNEKGRFELAELPGSAITLEALKRGFAPLVVPGLRIDGGEDGVDLGTLVLVPGASVQVRVTDADGVGLAGVAAWTSPDFGPSLRQAVARLAEVAPEAESDAGGELVLADLVPGAETAVLFHREGFLPELLTGLHVPGERPLTVTLRRAAAVSGRVVDEDGAPVAAADVSLWPHEPPPGTVDPVELEGEDERHTTSDEDGRFAFAVVTPGVYDADAFARGYQVAETRSLEVVAGLGMEDLDFVLRRGATLQGRTLDQNGEPLVGVQVIAGRPASFSDAEGFYRVEGLPTGTQEVVGRHLRLEPVVREVEIQPGTNTLDLVFAAGYEVSGRVVDGYGEGISGVELVLLGGRRLREHFTRSATDGSFRLPDLTDGVYSLRAHKPGYAVLETAEAVRVEGAGVDGLEVTLEPEGVIRGRILGLDLLDLERLTVVASRDGAVDVSGRVDYEGSYEVRGLGLGDYVVQAALRNGSREAEARVSLSGQREVHRDLLFGGGLTLSGRVLLNGEPLPQTTVAVAGLDVAVRRQVECAYDGTFRLEDLEAGRYRLDASNRRERLAHNQDIEVYADQDLLVEIATVRVSGVVTAGGEPLPDALVALHRQMGPGAVREGSLFTVGTDAEGGFRFSRLVSGRYQVTVKKDGFAPFEEMLDLTADLEGLRYALDPAAGLALSVRLGSGRRPPFVHLAVFDTAGRPLLVESRKVDGAGTAFFPTVPAGEWELLVGAPGGAPARVRVSVPDEPAEVVLADAGRLKVRLPGLVESNVQARLRLAGPDAVSFRSFDHDTGRIRDFWELRNGTAVVEGVPAGEWSIEIVAANGATWQGVVVATGAPLTEVEMP